MAGQAESTGGSRAVRQAASGRRGLLLGVGVSLGLAACAVGPDFKPPEPPAAGSYLSGPGPRSTVAADGQSQRFDASADLPAHWWQLFHSAPLDAAVEQALAKSPTLAIAEANLRQSQDNLRAGEGLFYPHLSVAAGATRERIAPIPPSLGSKAGLFDVVTLGGSISYALDLFGGQRRTVEGLGARAEALHDEQLAAWLSLSANVVNTVVARAAYAAQVQATRDMIALQADQLSLVMAQERAGTASLGSELSLRSAIDADQASLAALLQKQDQADHLLASLEGATPSSAALPRVELDSLALPQTLPLSLPSSLVRQRPDVLEAEAQLHVASANIGVATAAMFPSISLGAGYGGAGTSLGNLFTPVDRTWSIGPSVTVPLFEGGSLLYSRRAAIDAYQAAQASYQQTVLAAFAQVADVLTALGHDAEAVRAQAEAQASAFEALKLVRANFQGGVAAWSDVLIADVQYRNARLAYVQVRAQRLQDTVALYAALGGGWWQDRAAAP